MVYVCYSLSLNVCVVYNIFFFVFVQPLKATVRLAFR